MRRSGVRASFVLPGRFLPGLIAGLRFVIMLLLVSLPFSFDVDLLCRQGEKVADIGLLLGNYIGNFGTNVFPPLGQPAIGPV